MAVQVTGKERNRYEVGNSGKRAGANCINKWFLSFAGRGKWEELGAIQGLMGRNESSNSW